MTPSTFQSPQWRGMVADGAQALGVAASQTQLEQCAQFASMLMQANKRVNLTSIRDPKEIAIKHFVDSLAPLPHVPEGAIVADIGSGAGFPGLVMALFRPDIKLASIETIRKKTSFQKHVALSLNLANVDIFNIRAENWSEEGPEGMLFDVVTCRALADLPTILEWGAPMLAPGGRIIAMKGKMGDQELKEWEQNQGQGFTAMLQLYCLPLDGSQRCLLMFEPES